VETGKVRLLEAPADERAGHRSASTKPPRHLSTPPKLAQATARLGVLFLYGALSPEPTPLPLFDVLGKWITIRGYVMMEITSDPAHLERAKKFVNDGLASGSFKPLVARTFPLDKIVEAHRFLESNQQIGKIGVTV
jgi:NADPH:quinone reductase-like Zn-dependent oxidoreductase